MWLPPKSTPDNYSISYSCQLICGSSVTHQNTSVAGPSITHVLVPATPGSSCSVDVMAIFSTNNNNNNNVFSSINTASECIIMRYATINLSHWLLLFIIINNIIIIIIIYYYLFIMGLRYTTRQKQEVSCTQWYARALVFHNKTTSFNNHPYVYISSSGTSVGTKFTATCVGMVVEWPRYGVHVHITVCMARLVFVLCQPVHSSLHWLDFRLKIFLWKSIIISLTYTTQPPCSPYWCSWRTQ